MAEITAKWFDEAEQIDDTAAIAVSLPPIAFRLRAPGIGGAAYSFTVPARYREGDILTDNEAAALNQLRTENIQNNMRKVFASEFAGVMPGELLSPEAIKRMQEAIERYAGKYEFPSRHIARPREGAIEKEARAIALEEVEIAARAKGTEFIESDCSVEIERIAGLDWVQAEARQRVQARAAIAAQGLEALL